MQSDDGGDQRWAQVTVAGGVQEGFPEAGLLNEVCARVHGCLSADLAWVSTRFVAPEARGLGVGRQLMRALVDDTLRSALYPCLEVLPNHPGAMTLYGAMGWRTVQRLRPARLSAVANDGEPDVHVMVLGGHQT